MKKFIADFKKFISRGNIVDMAVGVIIGSAFSTIVTSLTNKIIMPFINYLLSAGGENGLEKAYTYLKYVTNADGTVDLEKSIYIDWGSFLTAIINFFLIALVLFIILRIVTRANKMFQETIEDVTNKKLREEKKAVWKQAKAEKKNFKKAWKEYLAEKEAAAAAAKALEEANKPKEEKLEDIMKDIRTLLQNANAKEVEVVKETTKKVKVDK